MSEESNDRKEAGPILEIDHITVERSIGFGEKSVGLRSVSLSVEAGEIHVFAGEAGSGRSLLPRLILGAMEPGTKVLGGAIRFGGADLLSLRSRKRRELRRRDMGFVGRTVDDVFNPAATVLQSLREFHRLGGRRDRMVEEKDWSDLFYSVGIVEPERILTKKVGELTLFQVQKIALMRTLISRARLLICDDSTADLDRVAESQFLELLVQLRDEYDITILMATGNLRGVGRFADQVSVFYEGGMLDSGEVEKVLSDPRFLYTAEFASTAPNLSDFPRELSGISREAIQEAEAFVNGTAHSAASLDGVSE